MDVTAITTRDDFLLELGEALGGQASVRPVDSIGAALEYLASVKRGQLLVIDARDVIDVRGDVDQAVAQTPHAVVLVFASPDVEKHLGATLKGSNVFALLPIPMDKRKTSAVLDGAIADAVAKRATARPSASSGSGLSIESFQPQAESSALEEEAASPKGKLALFAGAGVAVVALAAGAYWFFTQDKGASAPAAPAPTAAAPVAQPADTSSADDASLGPKPVVDTSIVQGKVDDLLEKARLAMRERHYAEPQGDNALLYYRSAAAADPTNGEARDGLQRVGGVLSSRFDEALNAGRYDEAALALANFKIASPQDPRVEPDELKLVTAQINKAIADGNLDRAAALVRQAQQSTAIPPDQIARFKTDINKRQEDAKVTRLANLISERIRDGKLTDPADDSAKTYFNQLRDFSPTNPTTQRAVREVNSAYLRKAKEAAASRNQADVDHWLAEARAGGVSALELNAWQRDLATATKKAQQAESDRIVQSFRERMRSGQLSDPANDSASYYLGQLQSSDPSNPAVATGARDLAAAFVTRAKASAQNNRAAQMDADLTQAKRWGADPKDIAAVQQIAVAARNPAPAPSLLRANTAVGGAPAGGAPAGSLSSPASLAANLKRTHYVPPEFPAKALSQRLNGSVTVEYVVDPNGETRDVRVVEATPPGVFDRAAITAVKHWKYDPVIVNGAPVEVPVRTSIRFELPQ